MIPLSLTSPSPLPLSFKPSLIPSLKPIYYRHSHRRKLNQRTVRNGKVRAELSADAPVAIAIGACILNSLVFPVSPSPEEEESDSLIDSADMRFAVMGIISFIPYFNWMSWVFAWLDTGKRRYAVYAIVYLAPYLRSNLSLSPEESWLPIASILICILHIQLEASIKNGELKRFQIFNNAAKHLSSITRKKDHEISEEWHPRDYQNLPSSRDRLRHEVENWRVPRNTAQDQEPLDKDGDGDEGGRR